MAEPQLKLIKNKPALLTGVVSALLIVLFGVEIIQYFAATLADAGNTGINFTYIFPTAVYDINEDTAAFVNYIVLLAPLLSAIILSQSASLLLFKFSLGFYRYLLMIFQLVLLGYMLIYLLYGAISIALNFNWSTDLQKFTAYLEIEYPANILVVFFLVFIVALFINVNAKKIGGFVNK